MPRFDGTGPEGKGEMTGRGLGDCNNDSTQVSVGKNSDTTGVQRYYGRGRDMNNNQMRGRGLGPCGQGMRNGLGRRGAKGTARGMGQGLGFGRRMAEANGNSNGRGLGLGRGRASSIGPGRGMGRGRCWN